jgi:deoxycytidine triphosphate deaminase
MLLSRQKILELVKGKNLIENFDESCVESAGYDLRVGRAYKLESDSHLGVKERRNPKVREIEFERYNLILGEYLLIETIEKVNIPDNILARILPRSTLFRCGCSLITAIVDPGYKGTLTMGLKNLSEFNFEFEKGSRVAQIVFENVDEKTKGYNGKYQGGKVV